MVRVFLRELRKAGVGPETVYGASNLHMRVGQYLWHNWRTLSSRALLGQYLSSGGSIRSNPVGTSNTSNTGKPVVPMRIG